MKCKHVYFGGEWFLKSFLWVAGFACLLGVVGLAPQGQSSENNVINEPKASELKVLRTIPAAQEAGNVSQISIAFNQPMIALGETKVPLEFISVTPSVSCEWTYVDASNLACNLPEPLPGSNRYTVKIKKGIQSLSGAKLLEDHALTFTTSRWTTAGYPRTIDWKSLDEPIIAWSFTQPLRRKNIASHFRSNCGTVIVKQDLEKSKTDKNEKQKQVQGYKHILVTFKKPIGENMKCWLGISKQAKSVLGDAEGMGKKIEFKTFPKFYIDRASCGNARKKNLFGFSKVSFSSCSPSDGRVSIHFSSPVESQTFARYLDSNLYQNLQGKNADLKRYLDSQAYAQNFWLEALTKANTSYRLDLSKIHDRFGRKLEGLKTIQIKTVDFEPSASMPSNYLVVEKKGLAQVPLMVRNMNKLNFRFNYTNQAERANELYQTFYPQRRCKEVLRNYSKILPYPFQIIAEGSKNKTINLPIDLDQMLEHAKIKNASRKYGMLVGNTSKLL